MLSRLVRGAFRKYVAWSFISEIDLETLSSLVSFGILYVMTQIHEDAMMQTRKYYCEYMYCLFTGKSKISMENISFYIKFLKSVQNINNSS